MHFSLAYFNRKKIIIFIIFAYGISWLIWLPKAMNTTLNLGWNISDWNHIIGGLGPFTSAIITTYLFGRKEGVYKYFKEKLLRLPDTRWLLIGLLLPVAFFLIPVVVIGFVTGEWINFSTIGLNSKVPVTNVFLIWVLWCFFYGLGEEGGWRGFLMPEFTKIYNARISTLYTALIWAPWHLPVFFYDKDLSTMGIFGTFGWVVGLVFGSLLLGWLVKQSEWNLWPVILWHGTFNLFTTSDRIDPLYSSIMSMLVILIVFWITRKYGENLTIDARVQNLSRE
ncbi:MAG: CPBP family intramembrane glutamic endopeptidase [Candidatus Aminicenantaceae bacterium]